MIQVEHLTKYYGDFLAVDDPLKKGMSMVFSAPTAPVNPRP